jgi:hypothetical protein
VVFDQQGDVFISDTGTAGGGTCSGGSDNGGIWEVPYQGSNTWGTPAEVIAFSSGNQPNGLAINSSGDLFVADNGNSTIYEYAKEGTNAQGYAQFLNSSCATSTTAPDPSCYQQQTIANTGSGLIGLAIAPDGSLYFVDHATGVIEHAVASSNTWTLTSTGIAITGDTYAGIAISTGGNLFYDDYSSGIVYEAVSNGSNGFGSPTQLATSASNGANYLTVDSYGNVFYVDSQNASLYEIPLNSNSTYGATTPLLTGLASYAVGMGIDSLDNFYVQNSLYDLEEYTSPLQAQSSSTITINSSPPPTSSSGPGGTYTVSATPNTGPNTSSNTNITVTIDPSTTANCSALNLTVTFIAPGACKVNITRGGDGTYAPYQTSQTFVIGYGSPRTVGALLAPDPTGNGYWVATQSGSVTAYGAASSYGSESGQPINAPIVGIVASPDGKGYWLVGSDGGIFSFGDAQFYGSEGGRSLNAPVVGMEVSADDSSYSFANSIGVSTEFTA